MAKRTITIQAAHAEKGEKVAIYSRARTGFKGVTIKRVSRSQLTGRVDIYLVDGTIIRATYEGEGSTIDLVV